MENRLSIQIESQRFRAKLKLDRCRARPTTRASASTKMKNGPPFSKTYRAELSVLIRFRILCPDPRASGAVAGERQYKLSSEMPRRAQKNH